MADPPATSFRAVCPKRHPVAGDGTTPEIRPALTISVSTHDARSAGSARQARSLRLRLRRKVNWKRTMQNSGAHLLNLPLFNTRIEDFTAIVFVDFEEGVDFFDLVAVFDRLFKRVVGSHFQLFFCLDGIDRLE